MGITIELYGTKEMLKDFMEAYEEARWFVGQEEYNGEHWQEYGGNIQPLDFYGDDIIEQIEEQLGEN